MKKLLAFCLLFAFLLTACGPSDADLAAMLQSTLTAWPTNSPYPTYTLAPTQTARVIIVTPTLTPTPLFTATITPTPTNTLPPTPTLDPRAYPKSDGFYLVNVDIIPGVWRSTAGYDDCYWQVSSKTGNIISNFYGMSGGTMFIPNTAYEVQLEDCGEWTYLP